MHMYNRFNNMPAHRDIIIINEDKDFEDFYKDEELDFDDSLNEADGDNQGNETEDEEPPMSEEKLKIEALKIATSMCKLMDNVVPEDIIKTAGKVAEFIRNNGQASLGDTENNFTDAPDEEIQEPAEKDTEDFE